MIRAQLRAGKSLLTALFTRASEANLDLIAAGVAFYGMLATFPAVASLIALWGFFADPVLVDQQLDALRGLMPPEAFGLLDRQVAALVAANSSTLGWASALSLGAALWSTRAGVGALVRGLNAVYGLKARSGFWHSLAALGLTMALIAFALLALVAVVGVPILLAVLPMGGSTSLVLEASRWGLLIAAGLAALWLVYRIGPNHQDARPHWLVPGVLLSLALWVGASLAFSAYVAQFAAYNQVYGSIGAVIILLIWLFLTAYSVLLGAALNHALDRRAPADP